MSDITQFFSENITFSKPSLLQSEFTYDTHTLLQYPFHRAKDTEKGYYGIFGKDRKKSERRRKRKRWVMNYRADHFRLGPGKERERPRERERFTLYSSMLRLVRGKPLGRAIYGQFKRQQHLSEGNEWIHSNDPSGAY